MRLNAQKRREWSTAALETVIRPDIEQALGARLRISEGSNDPIHRSNDISDGVDAWIERDGRSLAAASRIQGDDYDFLTFTIRYRLASGALTEFDKRFNELADDEMTLGWVFHAYTDGDWGNDRPATWTKRFGIMKARPYFRFVLSAWKQWQAVLWPRALPSPRDRFRRPGDSFDTLACREVREDKNQFISVDWAALHNAGLDFKIFIRDEKGAPLRQALSPSEALPWARENAAGGYRRKSPPKQKREALQDHVAFKDIHGHVLQVHCMDRVALMAADGGTEEMLACQVFDGKPTIGIDGKPTGIRPEAILVDGRRYLCIDNPVYSDADPSRMLVQP